MIDKSVYTTGPLDFGAIMSIVEFINMCADIAFYIAVIAGCNVPCRGAKFLSLCD